MVTPPRPGPTATTAIRTLKPPHDHANRQANLPPPNPRSKAAKSGEGERDWPEREEISRVTKTFCSVLDLVHITKHTATATRPSYCPATAWYGVDRAPTPPQPQPPAKQLRPKSTLELGGDIKRSKENTKHPRLPWRTDHGKLLHLRILSSLAPSTLNQSLGGEGKVNHRTRWGKCSREEISNGMKTSSG
jgi:hypothetical protein